ncbi:MAG: pilus assembly protein PilM [Thermodesulfobacterium sp.]|nr:pilus assembly protein PilM [Thermodesulfobacterium sp.]
MLQFLKRIKREGFLSFDLGSSYIKIAEIQQEGDNPILTGFIRGKTFENAIINGIINNEELLFYNIKNLLDIFKPSIKKVYLSLPYDLVILGNFFTKDIENLEAIKKQIDDEIPYKIEDVYYDYYTIPSGGNYEVFYIVSKKSIVDSYVKLFNHLNFEIVNIDADIVNLHNYTEFFYEEENKLIIDWGYSKIKLFFCEKKAPVYGRELLNLGLKSFISKVAKELKISQEIAEKLIVNPTKNEKKEQVLEMYKDYIRELLKEIEYSLDLIFNKFNFRPTTIYLVGGGAAILNIENILGNFLNISIKKLTIENKIKISKDIDPNYLPIINTQGALAIATAIKDFI